MASEYFITRSDELKHYGIQGQKWGVRRFENYDGTLTPEGKERYGIGDGKRPTDKQITNYKGDRVKYYKSIDKRVKRYDELVRKANALADKYDFDRDDGGGGSTPAASRAGKKYMKYWEEAEELIEQASKDIEAKVNKEVIDVYGKERIDSYKFNQDVKNGMATVALLGLAGIYITHPVKATAVYAAGITTAAVYVAIRDTIKKKKDKDNE